MIEQEKIGLAEKIPGILEIIFDINYALDLILKMCNCTEVYNYEFINNSNAIVYGCKNLLLFPKRAKKRSTHFLLSNFCFLHQIYNYINCYVKKERNSNLIIPSG